ncbi:uncharacterized protein LOC143295183 [Babylonia areolata]|uniref:uncharacterized protein LOC143295183 n=1 Tax=Babylonia areolata TaxID=304850 RepID=UPI003FD42B9C
MESDVCCDVSLSHTIDDDIAFERVRHMPRRTQFVSTHRQLSWQHDKEMRQHERHRKLSHVEMARAKGAMAQKLCRLQDAKKEVKRQRSDPGMTPDRRLSDPSSSGLPQGKQPTDPKTTPTPTMKHSPSAPSFPVTHVIPEDGEAPGLTDNKRGKEGASFPDAQHSRSGRRATIAEGVVEADSLPPHLVRRLSHFMDSTSALLMNPSAGGGRSVKDQPRGPGLLMQQQQGESDPVLLGSGQTERSDSLPEVA